MNSNRTDNGSGNNAQITGHPAHRHHTTGEFFAHPLRHAKGLVRLSRRRHSLAFGLAVTVGSVLGSLTAAVATVTSHAIVRTTEPDADTLADFGIVPHAPRVPLFRRKVRSIANSIEAMNAVHTNPFSGLASWYGGNQWQGKPTSSGEIFDESKLTAAHRTLPLGTLVRVTNTDSNRSVVVKINDRGTFRPNRVIDLSSAAAEEIGMHDAGVAHVTLEVLRRT